MLLCLFLPPRVVIEMQNEVQAEYKIQLKWCVPVQPNRLWKTSPVSHFTCDSQASECCLKLTIFCQLQSKVCEPNLGVL